jgi:hypothetical protein
VPSQKNPQVSRSHTPKPADNVLSQETLTAAEPPPPDLAEALAKIHDLAAY